MASAGCSKLYRREHFDQTLQGARCWHVAGQAQLKDVVDHGAGEHSPWSAPAAAARHCPIRIISVHLLDAAGKLLRVLGSQALVHVL